MRQIDWTILTHWPKRHRAVLMTRMIQAYPHRVGWVISAAEEQQFRGLLAENPDLKVTLLVHHVVGANMGLLHTAQYEISRAWAGDLFVMSDDDLRSRPAWVYTFFRVPGKKNPVTGRNVVPPVEWRRLIIAGFETAYRVGCTTLAPVINASRISRRDRVQIVASESCLICDQNSPCPVSDDPLMEGWFGGIRNYFTRRQPSILYLGRLVHQMETADHQEKPEWRQFAARILRTRDFSGSRIFLRSTNGANRNRKPGALRQARYTYTQETA